MLYGERLNVCTVDALCRIDMPETIGRRHTYVLLLRVSLCLYTTAVSYYNSQRPPLRPASKRERHDNNTKQRWRSHVLARECQMSGLSRAWDL